MPIFILFGYLIGLAVGILTVVTAAVALSLPIPAPLAALAATIATILATILGPLSPLLVVILVFLLLLVSYLIAYIIATISIAPSLPAGTTFPLAVAAPTPAGVPVPFPASSGEFFARGWMIGETAILNALPLTLIPVYGVYISVYVFIVVSLAAVIFVARNRVYQGFLGWTAWLCPVSYFATAVGALLFVVNAPFAFAVSGPTAFLVDFTTGVIETSGGIIAVFYPTGGFSLGNFNFITPAGAGGGFLISSTSSHETGHTLNTAAFGGVVLWINAIDENILPSSMNFAYGELTAEGHAQVMPVPPPLRAEFFIRLWV